MVFSAFISNPRDGVMIPVPQYPLYSATISVCGGAECHYYMEEETGWQITVDELEKSYNDSKKLGITPKILVVINPGNPTGSILSVLFLFLF